MVEDPKQVAEQVHLDQKEANERLVLTTIRALEQAEEAECARIAAETRERVARAGKAKTERIASELEQRERELRATAATREEFLAIVGHDLRNPLAAILMNAAALTRQGQVDERESEFLVRICQSAQRMIPMIEQILDFTRARLVGGLRIDLTPTDLGAVCRQVVEEFDAIAPSRVRCEFTGDLTGTWDAVRLAAVVSNLTANAIDHATPGTEVVITARGEGGEVVLEVSNQGEPISPAMLPVLFDAFRRGRPNGSAPGSHLGLGLYIAHQAIVAHGGTLTARCSGGTTTFAIRLPRCPPFPHGPPPV